MALPRPLAVTTTILLAGGLLMAATPSASADDSALTDPALAACLKSIDPTFMTSLDCYGVKSLEGIEAYPQLTRVELLGESMPDLTPLTKLPALEELHLQSDVQPDVGPISDIASLRTLGLWSLPDPQSAIEQLDMADQLTTLQIGWGPLTDLAPLAEYAHLTELQVVGTGISDISPLASLTGLEYLDLSANQISDLSPLPDEGPYLQAIYQDIPYEDAYVGDAVTDYLPPLIDRKGQTITTTVSEDSTNASAEAGVWATTGSATLEWSVPTNGSDPDSPYERFSGSLTRNVVPGPRPTPPAPPVEPVDPTLPITPPSPEEQGNVSPAVPAPSGTTSGNAASGPTDKTSSSAAGSLAQTGGTVSWFAPLAAAVAALGGLLLVLRRKHRAADSASAATID